MRFVRAKALTKHCFVNQRFLRGGSSKDLPDEVGERAEGGTAFFANGQIEFFGKVWIFIGIVSAFAIGSTREAFELFFRFCDQMWRSVSVCMCIAMRREFDRFFVGPEPSLEFFDRNTNMALKSLRHRDVLEFDTSNHFVVELPILRISVQVMNDDDGFASATFHLGHLGLGLFANACAAFAPVFVEPWSQSLGRLGDTPNKNAYSICVRFVFGDEAKSNCGHSLDCLYTKSDKVPSWER